VIVADIDSGADPVTEWNGVPLAPYLAPGVSFLGSPSSGDTQGPGGHGSLTAATIAEAIQGAGLPATVLPLVAIDSTGSANPSAVAAALQWVAASARSSPANTWIVCLPVQGLFPSRPEQRALRACQAAGAVMAIAAGNYGLNIDRTPVYPAAYGSPSAIVATAVGPDGSLPNWADRGRRTVQVAAPSLASDGYGHPVELASSGSCATAAGWLAAQAETTGRPVWMPAPSYAGALVWAVEASAAPTAGTAGQVGCGVLGWTARPLGGAA
jgi:Subtilase family